MNEFQVLLRDSISKKMVIDLLRNRWGSVEVVSRGVLHDASQLPGFAAIQDDNLIGLITYNIQSNSCEIVTLDSVSQGIGVGSALIESVLLKAREQKCVRLWVITTNDNLHALSFYKKQGFHIIAIHRNSIECSRKLKPYIPKIGMFGIPIRDEIELEMLIHS
jgi:GNAT superfamily N-acetyltransferase